MNILNLVLAGSSVSAVHWQKPSSKIVRSSKLIIKRA